MAALTKPISLTSMASLLATQSKVSSVCTANSINMYSGNKPMRINTTGEATAAQKKAANYGYVFPIGNLSDILLNQLFDLWPSSWTDHSGDASYRPILNEWYYAKPRGISYNEWYRLLDFAGYEHAVVKSLLDSNIPTNFVLGQSGTFYASIFQQSPSMMANFWESGMTHPMALTGMAYHAFGVAVAGPQLRAEDLQGSSAGVRGGTHCKYYIWASPVSGANFQKSLADDLFVDGAGTYRIVPFIFAHSNPIPAQSNIGSTILGIGNCIPLPCAYTTCVASSTPTPTESFTIYGRPQYTFSGLVFDFTFRLSYSSGLQGSGYNYTITQYSGSSVIHSINGSGTLNGTGTGASRQVTVTDAARWSEVANMRIELKVMKQGYPDQTKDFVQSVTPVE